MNVDLLYPDPRAEKRVHKLKRLVQGPNSGFLELKCKGCDHVTTTYSHAQIPVVCSYCKVPLATPAGGKAHLTTTVERYRIKEDF